MLELKRRPGQVVKIGRSAQLTVLWLRTKSIDVRLDLPGVKIFAPLQLGRTYQAEVDGYPIIVTLRSIELARAVGAVGKGEATLAFDAPRELSINRVEREGA